MHWKPLNTLITQEIQAMVLWALRVVEVGDGRSMGSEGGGNGGGVGGEGAGGGEGGEGGGGAGGSGHALLRKQAMLRR